MHLDFELFFPPHPHTSTHASWGLSGDLTPCTTGTLSALGHSAYPNSTPGSECTLTCLRADLTANRPGALCPPALLLSASVQPWGAFLGAP